MADGVLLEELHNIHDRSAFHRSWRNRIARIIPVALRKVLDVAQAIRETIPQQDSLRLPSTLRLVEQTKAHILIRLLLLFLLLLCFRCLLCSTACRGSAASSWCTTTAARWDGGELA